MNDIPAVGIRETVALLESGQVKPLEDAHSIEAALELIKQSEAKISEFKELKKKRTQLIDQEIENLTSRCAFLESVILETLNANKKKSISFPGIGKVGVRKKTGKWIIKDEAALIEALKKEGEYAQIVQTQEVIKKAELNKLLDVWLEINKLPQGAVEKEPDGQSVSISFEKSTDDANAVPVAKAPGQKQAPEIKFDLDELNFA